MCLRVVVVAELVLREGGGLDGWYLRWCSVGDIDVGSIVIGAEGEGFGWEGLEGGLFWLISQHGMVWVMHVRGMILVVFECALGRLVGARRGRLVSLHTQFICFPILTVFDAPYRLPFS